MSLARSFGDCEATASTSPYISSSLAIVCSRSDATDLEDEKVLGLDENVEFLELLVVGFVGDRFVVETIF